MYREFKNRVRCATMFSIESPGPYPGHKHLFEGLAEITGGKREASRVVGLAYTEKAAVGYIETDVDNADELDLLIGRFNAILRKTCACCGKAFKNNLPRLVMNYSLMGPHVCGKCKKEYKRTSC